jgi:L-Ala-D/L-Glu epimerase
VTDARILSISTMSWPFAESFENARGAESELETLCISLADAAGRIGRGEAAPAGYAGETVATMRDQVEAVRDAIEVGASRDALIELLPAGAARCAIDAAMWDLEAKQSGVDPFTAAGVAAAPIVSAYTIGIRNFAGYSKAAAARSSYPLLKIKVGANDPMGALRAVRAAAPESQIIVDPNQSWSPEQLVTLAPTLRAYGVVLIEQPIAEGAEADLLSYVSPVPLCADELVSTEADLERAYGCFEVINIKLEKAGGLTAALRLADAAERMGFSLMVGCMGGSSLSVAPAMVLAQRCDFVDLDAPLILSSDCTPAFDYRGGIVAQPHIPTLWG